MERNERNGRNGREQELHNAPVSIFRVENRQETPQNRPKLDKIFLEREQFLEFDSPPKLRLKSISARPGISPSIFESRYSFLPQYTPKKQIQDSEAKERKTDLEALEREALAAIENYESRQSQKQAPEQLSEEDLQSVETNYTFSPSKNPSACTELLRAEADKLRRCKEQAEAERLEFEKLRIYSDYRAEKLKIEEERIIINRLRRQIKRRVGQLTHGADYGLERRRHLQASVDDLKRKLELLRRVGSY